MLICKRAKSKRAASDLEAAARLWSQIALNRQLSGSFKAFTAAIPF